MAQIPASPRAEDRLSPALLSVGSSFPDPPDAAARDQVGGAVVDQNHHVTRTRDLHRRIVAAKQA